MEQITLQSHFARLESDFQVFQKERIVSNTWKSLARNTNWLCSVLSFDTMYGLDGFGKSAPPQNPYSLLLV